MGWRFRRSFSIGPVRINISKTGMGVSVGARGLRVGAGPRGPYTSTSIPGTGVYRVDYWKFIRRGKTKAASLPPALSSPSRVSQPLSLGIRPFIPALVIATFLFAVWLFGLLK